MGDNVEIPYIRDTLSGDTVYTKYIFGNVQLTILATAWRYCIYKIHYVEILYIRDTFFAAKSVTNLAVFSYCLMSSTHSNGMKLFKPRIYRSN